MNNIKTSTINDFELKKIWGKGSFATVFLAKRKEDNKEYAIKEVNIMQMNELNMKYTLNEIRILASFEYDYIVNYVDAFIDNKSSKLYIVMELLKGGDLESKINLAKNKNMKFNEETIWIYAIQILLGLKFLEEKNIIHRDIKPANLFLNEDHKIVKLGDLNVAKISQNNFANTQIGTPLYIAPEIWKNEKYTSKCDIFSLGCVLYQLAALKLPFIANSMDQLRKNIIGGFFSRIPYSYSDELYILIKSCLEKNQNKRPSITQLLNSNYIKKRMHLINNNISSLNQNINKLMGTINLNKLKLNQVKLPKRYNKASRAGSVNNIHRKNSIDFKITKKDNSKVIPSIKKSKNLPPRPNNKGLPPIPNKKTNESIKNHVYNNYNYNNYKNNYNSNNSNSNSRRNTPNKNDSKLYGIRNQSPRVSKKNLDNYYNAYDKYKKNINNQVNKVSNYKKKTRINSADIHKRYNNIVSNNRPFWWG